MGASPERDNRGDGRVVGGSGASERDFGVVEAGGAGGVDVGLEAELATEIVLDTSEIRSLTARVSFVRFTARDKSR